MMTCTNSDCEIEQESQLCECLILQSQFIKIIKSHNLSGLNPKFYSNLVM